MWLLLTNLDSMSAVFSDRFKFSEITEPIDKSTRRMEDRVNNLLSRSHSLSILTNEVYNSLFVPGSGAGILCGLPKMHKIN